VVIMFAIGPKAHGFKPGQGWFLRAIKIHSLTSFRVEVKLLVPYRSFYSMLKIPAECIRDALLAKFKDISRRLPASLLDVSAAIREL
jgi:hypothetical protein